MKTHCSKSSFFVQKFNLDFPRKLSIFFSVKNSWKCYGFGLFSCRQLWYHEKNCHKKIWVKNSWKCWGSVKIEFLDKNLTFRILCSISYFHPVFICTSEITRPWSTTSTSCLLCTTLFTVFVNHQKYLIFFRSFCLGSNICNFKLEIENKCNSLVSLQNETFWFNFQTLWTLFKFLSITFFTGCGGNNDRLDF